MAFKNELNDIVILGFKQKEVKSRINYIRKINTEILQVAPRVYNSRGTPNTELSYYVIGN